MFDIFFETRIPMDGFCTKIEWRAESPCVTKSQGSFHVKWSIFKPSLFWGGGKSWHLVNMRSSLFIYYCLLRLSKNKRWSLLLPIILVPFISFWTDIGFNSWTMLDHLNTTVELQTNRYRPAASRSEIKHTIFFHHFSHSLLSHLICNTYHRVF